MENIQFPQMMVHITHNHAIFKTILSSSLFRKNIIERIIEYTMILVESVEVAILVEKRCKLTQVKQWLELLIHITNKKSS
ncbi:MAG TPA: hypothetical protein VN704_07440 [Verrucomicrobiae bacterium]|nr:hypothetical protein [Verrucomicrobiae bacterium]